MLLYYQIKPNGKIMTDKAPKIVHTYFNPEHISEIDDYVNEQKKLGRKNSEGRAYSRNDYFLCRSCLSIALGCSCSSIYKHVYDFRWYVL